MPRPSARAVIGWLLLAGLWTLANVVKPVTVDDTAYLAFARQIAERPLDPFGFSLFWYHQPQPALEILAPPVVLYWLAAGVRLFGESVPLLKLWMFPFALLFVAASHRLAARFARGMEWAVVVLLAASPVFLPALNLMLDVPAAALGLAALVLFLRAIDEGRVSGALLAGAVAGLAMQTKYTAFVVLPVMGAAGLCFGGFHLAVVAGAVAATVFAGWEGAVFAKYGQSQFLLSLREEGRSLLARLGLAGALVSLAGGTSSSGIPIGLYALGTRPAVVAAAAGLGLAAYAFTGWLPVRATLAVPGLLRAMLGRDSLSLGLTHEIFLGMGLILLAVMALVVRRLLTAEPGSLEPRARWPWHRWGSADTVFLLAWLTLEIVGYLFLTPFPAVRRVMGVSVVITLLLGRLAARSLAGPQKRFGLVVALAYAVVVGCSFAVVEWFDASAQRTAAAKAMETVRDMGQRPDARVWYVGHWGFQFYAEREGMVPVVPGRSAMRAGDWYVDPGRQVDRQRVVFPAGALRLTAKVRVDDPVPWRTVGTYYRGNVPLHPKAGARLDLEIYRVDRDIVPQPDSLR